MGISIARVKRKSFQPVTKLFHTMDQRKQECTTQQKISTACIIENKKRFSQIFDTPPICDALIEMIGYDVENKEEKTSLMGHLFLSLEHLSICRKVRSLTQASNSGK